VRSRADRFAVCASLRTRDKLCALAYGHHQRRRLQVRCQV